MDQAALRARALELWNQAGKDLEEVLFGKNGVGAAGKLPPVVVDCSTISVDESAAIRRRLKERGSDYVGAPVSGNAKVI